MRYDTLCGQYKYDPRRYFATTHAPQPFSDGVRALTQYKPNNNLPLGNWRIKTSTDVALPAEGTASAHKPKEKKMSKKKPAYIARIMISVPIVMDDPSSYANAVNAIKNLGKDIPGAEVKVLIASLGRMDAEPAPITEGEIPSFLKRHA